MLLTILIILIVINLIPATYFGIEYFKLKKPMPQIKNLNI